MGGSPDGSWWGPQSLPMEGDDCSVGGVFWRESTGVVYWEVGIRPPRPQVWPGSDSGTLRQALEMAGAVGATIALAPATQPPLLPSGAEPSTGTWSAVLSPDVDNGEGGLAPWQFETYLHYTSEGAACASGLYLHGARTELGDRMQAALDTPGDEGVIAKMELIAEIVGVPPVPYGDIASRWAFFRVRRYVAIVNPEDPPEEQYEDVVHWVVQQISEVEYLAHV